MRVSSNPGNHERDAYAEAGVDIAAGEALVERIKPAAAATARAGADAALGGFGAIFDPRAAGFDDPLLIASTDGVGTKLKIAHACRRHRGVGVDLVAMCANDILVQGAEPLFFLDYFATSRLEPEIAAEVVEGISEGCRQAGCALIGGETAEMPGLYAPGDYDLAGFAVGAVERGKLLTGADIAVGDRILGLASSGLHSNGFSLVRRLVETAGLDYGDPAPFAPSESLGEALLHPTRLYVQSCLSPARDGRIKALAHITGGGLLENVPRSLPRGVVAVIDAAAWDLPPVFAWLVEAGKLSPRELARTFNCGIGMAAIVAKDEADSLASTLAAAGETVWPIGRIEAGAPDARPSLRITGPAGHWGADRAFTLDSGG